MDYELLKVAPYLVVLVGALIGLNVFVVLIAGTILTDCGVGTGADSSSTKYSPLWGRGDRGDINVISFIVACIVSLVKEHGD